MKEFSVKKYNSWSLISEIDGFVFDLQFFASAEDEGRTEEPTEKKIREAREKGQVAKTQELPQAIVVIFGFLVILVFSSFIYDTIAAITKYYVHSQRFLQFNGEPVFPAWPHTQISVKIVINIAD